MKTAVIMVKEVTAKKNSNKEDYFKIVTEDKRTYNVKKELCVPSAGDKFNIEYREESYPYEGKTVTSKWIDKISVDGVSKAREVFGGEVKENKSLGNAVVTNVDSKIWDDAVYLTGCFVTGKDGSLEKMCDMTKEIYNELLSVRKKL